VSGPPAGGVAAGPVPGRRTPDPGPTPPSEQTRLAIRLVLHLARYGTPREDGSGKPEATQEGISMALSTTQGAVSKILSRLAAAGALRYEHRRVEARGRRVRVYGLTRRGELLAAEVRQSLEPRPPSP
jgi:DNA-binding MarR family transcriptional regulator